MRIVEERARHRDHIGFALGNDRLGLFGIDDHADDANRQAGFAPHPRMHHHLLGCLVYGQQLAQLDERLFARLGVGRMQYFIEHVLDEVVLRFEERNDLVG